METNLAIKKDDTVKIISIEGVLDIHLSKTDILSCGHSAFPDEGCIVIVTDVVEVRKEILMTSLALKMFGPEYKIVKTCEYENEETDMTDVLLYTNLPRELYEETLESL